MGTGVGCQALSLRRTLGAPYPRFPQEIGEVGHPRFVGTWRFPTCSVVERDIAKIPSVMASLSLTSIVCHMPNQVAADVAGETVLMSLARSRCYGLGGIGSEIWSRLMSPVRVSELLDELSARYEAPPGVIERDVLQLLTQLAEEGLIKVS
jgi:hypothetical protein